MHGPDSRTFPREAPVRPRQRLSRGLRRHFHQNPHEGTAEDLSLREKPSAPHFTAGHKKEEFETENSFVRLVKSPEMYVER